MNKATDTKRKTGVVIFPSCINTEYLVAAFIQANYSAIIRSRLIDVWINDEFL